MSENNVASLENKELSPDQAEAVGGGDGCDVVTAVKGFAENGTVVYEAIVDFTSHVIERLVNSTK